MSPAVAAFDVRAALLAAARTELEEGGGISLRAVARRAGVSHAAPKHHFGDRAGLLTALAADGFRSLAAALAPVDCADRRSGLAALGAVYVDFGRAHRALFALMFSPAELHLDDPDLQAARHDAMAALVSVSGDGGPAGPDAPIPDAALLSWALAHGLLALSADGALAAATGLADADAVARALLRRFAEMVEFPPAP